MTSSVVEITDVLALGWRSTGRTIEIIASTGGEPLIIALHAADGLCLDSLAGDMGGIGGASCKLVEESASIRSAFLR